MNTRGISIYILNLNFEKEKKKAVFEPTKPVFVTRNDNYGGITSVARR